MPMLPMKQLEFTTFFTSDRMNEFFHNVRVLFYLGVPILLVFLAVEYGGQLIRVIRDAFSFRRDREDDYDDDYERD